MRVAAFSGLLLLALLPRPARAQGGPEEMRAKLEEISRLLRESERLLLEISQVDRLVQEQEEIVRKLRELEPPPNGQPPPSGEQERERERVRKELEKQQAEAARRIQSLFEGQQQAGDRAVKEIEELLRQLPTGQGSESDQQRMQRQREKERERKPESGRQESKQRTPEEQRREEERRREEEQRRRELERERRSEQSAEARMRRAEAWIARLPPEEQERLRRGDLSSVPLRYRRLIEWYTAERARREAEEPPR